MSDPDGALVLVVDDSEAGRYASVRFLRRAGFRVTEAATGGEGLDRVRRDRPDIVLLDVSLPDLSGLEVCRRIKEDGAVSSPLVIQVSASFVLVVEDDADTREMVTMVLSDAGAAVTSVPSVTAAEAAIAAATWDVLVSDLGMPDGDGYDLIRRLRARPAVRKLPALALSAHAMDTDARLSLAAGFDVHLPKPVDPDDLIRIVASLATSRSVGRAG